MAISGDPDADLEWSLVEWRRFRRRQRLAEVHWVDALYQAYLTALLGALAVLVLGDVVGDDAVSGAGLRGVRADGPAALAMVVAVAVAIGLRSGSRGGPLALERADVRHVLLAPVDRTTALRGPAVRQVRFAAFVGAVTGAVAGHLASNRLPGADAAWTASGAAFGLVTASLAYGAALVTSGLKVQPWKASALAGAVLAWSLGDMAGTFSSGPLSLLGRLALWPLDVDLSALVPVAVAVGLAGVGFSVVGGVSVESAERRSTLVGQLRFAATLQDIRTVIVLRRQLAMELPRVRPWARIVPHGVDRFPVWVRGWRGVLRWPAARVARVVVLGATAGLALGGVWDGTTPLLVVAGLALFVAALDAIEPLAQEIDHPSRRDSMPVVTGRLHLRHLPTIVAVSLLIALIAVAVALLVAPSSLTVEVAAAVVLPAALGTAGAGVVSVVMGAPGFSTSNAVLPPEAAGVRMAVRTAWPPVLATLGLAPVLAARAAVDSGRAPGDAVATAAAVGVAPLAVFAFVCAWVRWRDQARAAWQRQVESAFPSKPEPATDG